MSATTADNTRSIVNRTPMFYGWVVWLVSTIAIVATMPGQTASVSLFIDRWIADFGLDNRSTISALYGVGTFLASLGLTFIGNRVDKHGTRTMSIVISVAFALALVYMALVSNLAMLLIGFMLIRGLGQGSLFLVGSTAIANWFRQMRGRVMAFALIGFSLFQRWYIPFVQGLLETFAWQRVFLLLAAAILLLVLPLLALFIRETPERFGLLPDGDRASDHTAETHNDASDAPAPPLEDNYTLREVTRLPIFWVFLVGGMMTPAFVTGVLFHQESLFDLAGYSAATAAEVVGNGLLLASFSMLLTGFLVDRVRPSFVRGIELSALIALLLLSAFLGAGNWALVLWAVMLGIVNGTGGVFNGAVYANLFGRGHQGEIRGFVTTAAVLGTSVGPFLLALSYDAFGNYAAALYGGAAFVVLPLILGFLVNKPRERTSTT